MLLFGKWSAKSPFSLKSQIEQVNLVLKQAHIEQFNPRTKSCPPLPALGLIISTVPITRPPNGDSLSVLKFFRTSLIVWIMRLFYKYR